MPFPIRSPFSLKKGARIGVFSPSGPCDPKLLERSVELLVGWGYQPVVHPNAAGRNGYLAASDRERLEATVWALSSSEVEAAWMARGGYGLTRIIPELPWSSLVPRPVLGFSDGTALLYPLWSLGWQQLVHGPVLHSLVDSPEKARTQRFLAGEESPLGGERVAGGRARGALVGGNLCVLNSLCGTSQQFRGEGTILLLEDVTEQPYRLDRYLTQMRHSGCFEGVAGIALGQFSQCGSRPEQAVLTCLEDLGLPIVKDVLVGHGEDNRPFLYGREVVLDERGLSYA